jgi:hypothetical protein
MSFESAIQTAIYERLSAYAPLTAVITGVYDDVPQAADAGSNAAFPYVTIGDDTLNEWDTDTEQGADTTITIHSWSRARGRKEIKAIQGHIYDALHRYELPVTGHHLIACDWEASESLLDPDGRTRHGISRFRIVLQKQ